MRMRLLTVALVAGAPTASSAGYHQQDYVLSGYLDPPLTNASYAALAAANFTGVFGDRSCIYAGGAASLCTANARAQAALCTAHGLPACFPGYSAAGTVKLGGSVAGYYLRDEPHAADFAGLAGAVASLRRAQPSALVFINLLGGYMASEAAAVAWWGFKTYEQYVNTYLAMVKPDLLSFDLYPSFGDCGWAVHGACARARACVR